MNGVTSPWQRFLPTFIFSCLCFGQATWVSAQPRVGERLAVVPVVGCPSDGQLGPQPAPDVRGKTVRIDSRHAHKLAFYKGYDAEGILAPRGWHCGGVYGSNGSSLFVMPERFSPGDFFSGKFADGLAGPVIQFSFSYSDTSGRFAVARVIARVFPKHRAFVDEVVSTTPESAADFPSGPFPADKLTKQDDNSVEYLTPANEDGLGTMSRLRKSNLPIMGRVDISDDLRNGGMTHLAVRLLAEDSDLASYILSYSEQAE